MHPTARPQVHRALIRRFNESGRLLSVSWTTPDEPGLPQALRAVEAGADLVVAAGGDGTVRMVASGLAGTGIPLGVIALGTANVLASNLRLPRSVFRQWDIACDGANRLLDLGQASFQHPGTDWTPETGFVVLAGVGHDAATVADTGQTTKQRLGWLSYLWRGARRLAKSPIPMTLELDGRVSKSWAWSVLVGNCPNIPGGIQVFPGARPDDGMLSVLEAEVKHLAQWVPVVVSGLGRRPIPGSGLVRHRAREVLVTPQLPTPVQLDGDPFPPVTAARFRISPGALIVRAPRARNHWPAIRSTNTRTDGEVGWTSH